ncbi:MAG: thioredoxin family protein [Fimbriimonadaceae bacterium]|nr:thioredoxin family protein [Chitinophagales bacterium]
MKRIFITGFCLLFFRIFCFTQHAIEFKEITFQQSLELSAKENKPVLFMCYEDWCGHCEKMINEVFIDSTLAAFYNKNFICVKQDMTTGDGQALVKRFYITSFPTFVVLNKSGETIYQFIGEYKGADFIKMGETSLITENQIPYLKNQFENNLLDSTACYKYLQVLSKGRLPTQQVVNTYFEANKNNFEISSGNWKILSSGVSDINSIPFKFIIDHQKEFAEVVTQKKVDRKIYLSSAYNLQTAANANDTANYFLNRNVATTFNNSQVDSLIFVNDLAVYEKNKKWSNYISTALRGTETYSWNDATPLRRIAENIYIHSDETTQIVKASLYAKRSVKLKQDYFNTILQAKILIKLGYKTDAKLFAEEAKALAEKNKTNTSEAELIIKQCEE